MAADVTERLWTGIGGEPGDTHAVHVAGPAQILPSVFDVTGLAAASVAVAAFAAAQTLATRRGEQPAAVSVERRAASAAFLSERLFTPVGWQQAAFWDPIAGDYQASDGWIRLHTNYRAHRLAVQRVLGPVSDRTRVAALVAEWTSDDLETAVVDAGGCAAVMRDRAQWLCCPAGEAAAAQPIADVRTRAAATPADITAAERPYDGVRVLDLTRVIAGPVCTRFLAAYGADVLRVDPRNFDEVPALVPDMSTGKHRTALDLTADGDRAVFERLVADAHVLVGGLRLGALPALGYDLTALHTLNPSLITASLNAYGWDGPWRGRRGFDSLVQMSCGIAAAGATTAGADRPVPLPAQALDHATGYLLAAAIGRALTRLIVEERASDIRASLVATANVLIDYPTPGGLDAPSPQWSSADTEPATTSWGPARRVPAPGSIAGVDNRWTIDAGPLGCDPPAWAQQ